RILKIIREVSVRIIHGKNEGSDISLTLQAVLNDRATMSTMNDDEYENPDDNLQLKKKQQVQADLTESMPINSIESEVSMQILKPELMD
ncbi:unnamed protein product, partial [Adineta steineri]